MATDFIERTIPHVAGGSSEESDPHESANPISHRNLLVVTKLSKGKFPVYKMLSQANRQHYVMKVFDNNIPDSHAFYKNELRFCSMNHPHVVKIVGSGKVKTVSQHDLSTHVTYVLSEYAPHGDFLDLVINHRKELDEKLTRTYFRQLIEGLEYLHSKGIAHLDLKPENLLIAEDFSLKITDFDLSYVNGDREIIGQGTVLYRAPEFYNAKTDIQLESPYACDIYSAGIILFLLKSGGVYPHLEHEIIKGTDFDLTKLLERESSRFWTKHVEMQGKCKDVFSSDFKSLFSKMMKTNPKKRPSIKKIKESKWYNGPVYTPQELQEKMRSVLGL